MKRVVLCAVLIGLGCVQDHPCRDNTVLVSISFVDSRDRVDGVALRYSFDGKDFADLKPIARTPGVDGDDLELKVDQYSRYKNLHLLFAPLLRGQVVGSWAGKDVPLASGCTSVELVIARTSIDSGLAETPALDASSALDTDPLQQTDGSAPVDAPTDERMGPVDLGHEVPTEPDVPLVVREDAPADLCEAGPDTQDAIAIDIGIDLAQDTFYRSGDTSDAAPDAAQIRNLDGSVDNGGDSSNADGLDVAGGNGAGGAMYGGGGAPGTGGVQGTGGRGIGGSVQGSGGRGTGGSGSGGANIGGVGAGGSGTGGITGTGGSCSSGTRCNGVCVDTQNDPNNCGGCGKVCSRNHVDPYMLCKNGGCNGLCDNGYDDCNSNMLDDGCETPMHTDSNCTRCGDKCVASVSYIGVCGNWDSYFVWDCGYCNYGGPPYANCDLKPENGCEVSLTTDPKNCGSCGNACASGEVCSGDYSGQCHPPY